MIAALLCVLRVAMATAAFVLPGVVAISAAYPGRGLRWRWITGSTLGLAAAICASYLLSYLGITLLGPVWLVLALGAILWWFRAGRPALLSRPGPGGWILIIALALTGLLRVGMVAGREVPRGGLPTDIGCVCLNAATVAAAGDALLRGEPLTSRIVTVIGPGLARAAARRP